MTVEIIGVCEICGGDVVLPKAWMSTKPAVPTCEKCGATARSNKPVLPMTPPHEQYEHHPGWTHKHKPGEEPRVRFGAPPRNVETRTTDRTEPTHD